MNTVLHKDEDQFKSKEAAKVKNNNNNEQKMIKNKIKENNMIQD